MCQSWVVPAYKKEDVQPIRYTSSLRLMGAAAGLLAGKPFIYQNPLSWDICCYMFCIGQSATAVFCHAQQACFILVIQGSMHLSCHIKYGIFLPCKHGLKQKNKNLFCGFDPPCTLDIGICRAMVLLLPIALFTAMEWDPYATAHYFNIFCLMGHCHIQSQQDDDKHCPRQTVHYSFSRNP